MQREDGDRKWYPVGNKARNAIRRLGQEPVKIWSLQSPDKLVAAQEVAAQVSDDFVNGRISTVMLISPKLINMMSQRPEPGNCCRSSPPKRRHPRLTDRVARSNSSPRRKPCSRTFCRSISSSRSTRRCSRRCLVLRRPTRGDEQRQRQRKKLIDQLTVQMNNARQASITKEILEIVGGAEALSG